MQKQPLLKILYLDFLPPLNCVQTCWSPVEPMTQGGALLKFYYVALQDLRFRIHVWFLKRKNSKIRLHNNFTIAQSCAVSDDRLHARRPQWDGRSGLESQDHWGTGRCHWFLGGGGFSHSKMGLAWILVPSVIDGVGSVEIALLTIAWHKTTIHSLCVISRYVA